MNTDDNDDDLALWREYCEQIPTPNAPPGKDEFSTNPNAAWRSLPPTKKQLDAVNRCNHVAMKLGDVSIPYPKTRGEASDALDALVARLHEAGPKPEKKEPFPTLPRSRSRW